MYIHLCCVYRFYSDTHFAVLIIIITIIWLQILTAFHVAVSPLRHNLFLLSYCVCYHVHVRTLISLSHAYLKSIVCLTYVSNNKHVHTYVYTTHTHMWHSLRPLVFPGFKDYRCVSGSCHAHCSYTTFSCSHVYTLPGKRYIYICTENSVIKF